ncbi:Smr domain protein [hydrothermal vent metagenome]|uniref:Smr domain protein n=1 Tax=hydrothermal vent metagenome TaxID=652676 RepID=A0A1W1BWN5_9ZZZZ
MSIDKEDKSFFINAMQGVKPLKKSNTTISTKKNIPIKVESFKDIELDSKNLFSETVISNYQSNDILFFAKSGVQPKTLKLMKQGKIPSTPSLDLHGQTINEASESLTNFLDYHKDKKYIQIIHGKGYNSQDNKPVLKNLTDSFLKKQANVLAFCSCPINEGGAGAVFVLLKTKN